MSKAIMDALAKRMSSKEAPEAQQPEKKPEHQVAKCPHCGQPIKMEAHEEAKGEI